MTEGSTRAITDRMKLGSVCVYCGSSLGNNPGYAGAAERLGVILAQSGVRLVYGGGSIGLMGIMARATLRHGGEVNGVIPAFLEKREMALTEVSELTVTDDMHQRKQQMFERSDGFVALPGGIGTLEEVVEMMTWIQLGRHRKPIVLVNLHGFWEPLITLLGHMIETRFLHVAAEHGDLYQVVGEVEEVLPVLERRVAAMLEPPAAVADTNGLL